MKLVLSAQDDYALTTGRLDLLVAERESGRIREGMEEASRSLASIRDGITVKRFAYQASGASDSSSSVSFGTVPTIMIEQIDDVVFKLRIDIGAAIGKAKKIAACLNDARESVLNLKKELSGESNSRQAVGSESVMSNAAHLAQLALFE
jgi:hypothetical protein